MYDNSRQIALRINDGLHNNPDADGYNVIPWLKRRFFNDLVWRDKAKKKPTNDLSAFSPLVQALCFSRTRSCGLKLIGEISHGYSTLVRHPNGVSSVDYNRRICIQPPEVITIWISGHSVRWSNYYCKRHNAVNNVYRKRSFRSLVQQFRHFWDDCNVAGVSIGVPQWHCGT